MNADSIKIEHDEDGLHLIVETERGGRRFNFRIQDIAEALYDTVKAEIGPWLYERDMAQKSRPFLCSTEDVDESGGVAENSYDRAEAYDQADPKHKDWHSVHADHYDARTEK